MTKHPCTHSDFYNDFNKSFDDNQVNNYFCLDDFSRPVEGIYTSPPFAYYEFDVYAKNNSELYRSMFMNLLLFMPLGLCMPFALPKKVKIKGLLTIGAGMVLSIAIEAIQFFFSLGRCETDDVIMNTTGVIIGTSVYLFFFLVQTIKRKRRTK